MKLPIILYVIGSVFFLAGSLVSLAQKPAPPPPLRCGATDTFHGVTYRCSLAAQHAYGHYGEDKHGFMAWTDRTK